MTLTDTDKFWPWDGVELCAGREDPRDSHDWRDHTDDFLTSIHACEACHALRSGSPTNRVVIQRNERNQYTFQLEPIALEGFMAGCRKCWGITLLNAQVKLLSTVQPGSGMIRWTHMDCNAAIKDGFGPNRSDADYLAAAR